MKVSFVSLLFFAIMIVSCSSPAQNKIADNTPVGNNASVNQQSNNSDRKLFIDVHHLGAGKVTAAAVAAAHAKDLAVEGKYNVQFIKYWVDTVRGDVYCLSSTDDSAAIRNAHREAHGLLPDHIYPVTGGMESAMNGGKKLFLDIHEMGAGNVKAADVAGAHQKDLATEAKYGVNFVNYWVDEKEGVVMCLAEASDSNKVIATHKEAHGLLPKQIQEVKQGE